MSRQALGWPETRLSAIRRVMEFPWRNAILLVLTAATTTAFGAAVARCFAHGEQLTLNAVTDSYIGLLHGEIGIWQGAWFSLPLLMILLAHELGHYVLCRRRRVEASLPYFLPSPSLFGTLGAFIRMRSPIYSREALFDIGIGGPLAGFLALLPFLAVGIALSKAIAAPPTSDSVLFGTPLALLICEHVRFPGVAASQILLHPVALAAWAGLFATALNLIPLGQLDGGHIVYALGSEQWHKRIGLVFLGILIVAGFWYWLWWFWATAMFFFRRRHSLVYDQSSLSRGRRWLAVAAFILFILSATPVPVRSF